MTETTEDQWYAQARRELEQKRVAQQIWKKARLKAGDDPRKLAAHYIALRVAQLRRKSASSPSTSSELASSQAAELTILNPHALEAALQASSQPEMPDDAPPLPFDSPVAEENASTAEVATPLITRQLHRGSLAAAGLALLVICLTLAWWRFGDSDNATSMAAAPSSNAPRGETAMFRGNAARTGVYQQEGPQQFNEILWDFQGEDEIASAPLRFRDTLFIGGNDGQFYALNLADGQEKWRFRAKDAIVAAAAGDEHGIYVSSLDGHLYALDHSDGKQKWQLQAQGAIFASPAILNGTLYIGSQNSQFYAINSENGQIHWQAEIGSGGIDASPAILDGIIYVGSLDGHLYALDQESGHQLWEFKTEGAITATPAVSEDAVYAGSTDGYLYALERNSGKQKWRSKASDIIVAGACVATVSKEPGAVAAARAAPAEAEQENEAGEEKPLLSLSDESDIAQGETASEASVYFLSADGSLHALDRNGHIVWEFASESKTFTTPVIAGDVIYFSTTDGYLYALSREDGTTKWRAMFSSQPLSSPVAADGKLYFGSADHHIYAVK